MRPGIIVASLLLAASFLNPSPLSCDAADDQADFHLGAYAARLTESWDETLALAAKARRAAEAIDLFGAAPSLKELRLAAARRAYVDTAWEAALVLDSAKHDMAGAADWYRVCYERQARPSAYVFTRFANALDSTGRREEALRVLEKGLGTVPLPLAYPIYWNLGWSHYLAGRYDRTVECGVGSLQSDPRVAGPLFNAACACFRMGQGEQGLAWFGMAFAASFDPNGEGNPRIRTAVLGDYQVQLAARPDDRAIRAALCLLYLSQGMDDRAALMANGIPAGTIRRLTAFAGIEIPREALWCLARASVLWKDEDAGVAMCAALLGACRDEVTLDAWITRVIEEIDVGTGRNAVRLLRQAQDRIREGMRLLYAGTSGGTDNTPQKKRDTWREAVYALENAQPLSSVLLREAQTRLGLLLLEQGDLEGARIALEEAVAISGSIAQGGTDPSRAESLENLVFLDLTRGMEGDAKARTREAAEIWRRIPPYDAHPRFTALREGRVEPRPGRDFSYAVTRIGLESSTDTYFNYNLTELEGLSKEIAAKVAENGPDAPTYARIHRNLGAIIASMYEIVGRYGEAEELLNARLRSNAPGYRDYYGEGLLASLHVKMGRYEEAEKALVDVAARHESRQDPTPEEIDEYSRWLSALSDLAGLRKDFPRAERLRIRALLALDGIGSGGSEDYDANLAALAETYLGMDRFEKARVLLDRVAETQKLLEPVDRNPSYARTLSSLGLLYFLTGDFPAAEKFLLEAAQRQKEYQPAGRNTRYLETLERLARLYMETGRMEKARETITACLSANRDSIDKNFPYFSEAEKDRFLRTLDARTGLLLTIFEMTRGDDPSLAWTVLDYVLYAKGILFKTSRDLRGAVRRGGDPLLAAEYDRWLILQDSLKKLYSLRDSRKADLSDQIAPLESEANEKEKQLSRASDAYRLFLAGETRTARDVSDSLAADEAAVELFRYRSSAHDGGAAAIHYIAFILTPHCDQPQVVVLEDGQRLETDLLAAYRGLMLPYGSDEIAARAVYDGYWRRIDTLLAGKKTLSVSPDGVFSLLGIGTLRDPAGRWLIDRCDVRVVSSLLDLVGSGAKDARTDSAPPSAGDQAVLIGFPDYAAGAAERAAVAADMKRAPAAAATARAETAPAFRSLVILRSSTVSPLPGTREEVIAVDGLLKGQRVSTRLFLAEQAVEESVKVVRSPRILHVATHGFANEESGESLLRNPLLNTGLLLAGAEKTLRGELPPSDVEDGILTAYEAVQLPLEGTDLVVLSACSTGVGRIKPGEGVYNLQRAFGIAGASHVVMSLWDVDDEATKRFMTDFYRGWLLGSDLRAAFASTAKAMKDSGSPPCDWGAFVLVGP